MENGGIKIFVNDSFKTTQIFRYLVRQRDIQIRAYKHICIYASIYIFT